MLLASLSLPSSPSKRRGAREGKETFSTFHWKGGAKDGRRRKRGSNRLDVLDSPKIKRGNGKEGEKHQLSKNFLLLRKRNQPAQGGEEAEGGTKLTGNRTQYPNCHLKPKIKKEGKKKRNARQKGWGFFERGLLVGVNKKKRALV